MRGWHRFLLDDADESITLARVSLYVARLLGIIIQCPSQLLDRTVQASLKIDKDVVGPETPAKFLPSHKLSRPFQQEKQDLERLSGKFDPDSVLPQFPGSPIQKIGPKTHRVLRRHRLSELVVFHLHQFNYRNVGWAQAGGSPLIVYPVAVPHMSTDCKAGRAGGFR